jgi:hypothetical protein
MPLEIEFSINVICDVFESRTIAVGMKREAPGGATLTILPGDIQTRSLPPTMAYDALPFSAVLVEFAKDSREIAVGLFVNWLFQKLTSQKGQQKRVRINRKWVEISKDGLVKAITESIEYRE